MDLLNDERGQVSAELIIVLAAVLAVAVVFIQSLQDHAEATDKIADKKSSDAVKAVQKIKGGGS